MLFYKKTIARYTLHKKERIKKQKDIDLLFNHGQSFHLSPFKVYYTISMLADKEEPLFFGTGVGKKNFKKAVDRNRIKRLTREAFRTQKLPLKEKLISSGKQMKLFLVFTGKQMPDFALTAAKMQTLLNRLESEIQQ